MLSKQKNIIPLILSGGLLVLWFVAPYFSGRFTWGFDLLKYYSLTFRLIWLSGGLGLLAIAGYCLRGPLSPEPPTGRKLWPSLILAAIIFALYLLFRVSTPLLGDGVLRCQEIPKGRLVSLTEPLATLLYALIYKIMAAAGGAGQNGGRITFIISGLISGALALVIYLDLARSWFKGFEFFALIFLAGLGFNQLFYGYLENYSFFAAAVLGYLWAGARAVEGGLKVKTVTFIYSICVALHPIGAFLGPSLLYLWRKEITVAGKIRWGKAWTLMAILISIPALTYAADWFLVGRDQFYKQILHSWNEAPGKPLLPLWRGLWDYGIVSLGHWLDMLNQFLLTAAGGIFLLLGLVLTRPKVNFDQAHKFLSLAAAGGFLFLLVIDPKLGTARDWDLLAWSGIPLALWFLYWLRQNRQLQAMLGAGGVLSVWLFVPWLGVNSSEVRAVKRYENLLIKDPRSAAYGYENLAIYYRDKGNRAGEEQTYRKSVEAEPNNPRFLYNYALALAKNGQYQQSLYYYQSSLQIDPGRPKRWNDYGAALINAGRSREAEEALVKSVSLEPGNADAWYNLGIARVLLKSWAPADSAFETAGKCGFSQPWLYAYWGRVKLQRGFYSRSVSLLGTALERGVQDAEVRRDYEAARAAAGGGYQQTKEFGP